MKIKIEAKTLLPAVLHFAETYLTENDYKVLKKCLNPDHQKVAEDLNEDPIVKAGGLTKMLECFLKSNKDIQKKFKESKGKNKKRKNSSSEEEDESNDEAEKPAKKR